MSHLDFDAEALYADLLSSLRAQIALDESPPQLVGVAASGVWLAERLHSDLGLEGACGVLSPAMHRDDFSQRGMSASEVSSLLFDVNGAHVIVIDDVLYTGRTARAVLNELFDYGRPASVKLMVLVDRGGRELPVHADLAVTCVNLPATQSLRLTRAPEGHLSFHLQERLAPV